MKPAVFAAVTAVAAAAAPDACIFMDSGCNAPVPIVPGIIASPCMSVELNKCTKSPVSMLPWSYKITAENGSVKFARYVDGECTKADDAQYTVSGKSGACLGPIAEMMGMKAYVSIKYDAPAPKPTTTSAKATTATTTTTTVSTGPMTTAAVTSSSAVAPVTTTTVESPVIPTPEITATYVDTIIPVKMDEQPKNVKNAAGAVVPGLAALTAAVMAALL